MSQKSLTCILHYIIKELLLKRFIDSYFLSPEAAGINKHVIFSGSKGGNAVNSPAGQPANRNKFLKKMKK
jgi:hypothetical protein